jgi:pimeloyl-ACP methyl ester carboxylesterase
VALSLEVKKFINSEHVGKFVEILLPIEVLPEPQKKKKAKPRPEPEQDDEPEIQAQEAAEPALPPEEELPQAQQEEAPAEEASELAFEVEDEEEAPAPQFEKARIHYVEAGDGEPLILVHSIGQSIYTWRHLFAALSQNYRTILVDLPGHGFSSRPAYYNYTIQEQAHSLALFMDAVGIESAHFLTFSMGGAYVLDFAAAHPERLGRVICISPGGMSHEMPLAVKMLDSSLLGGIASLLYGVRTVEGVLRSCFFDQTVGINEDIVEEYYKTIADSEARRALRMSFHNFADEELASKLRSLEMPVLILQGAEDKWRTSAQIELYHAAIPNAGCAMIRNAGHLLHEEKPDRVLAAVMEFIPALCPEVE